MLVLSAASNPFSRFPVEILRAEGFNLFAAKDVSIVTPDTLNAFDVVIVGDIRSPPPRSRTLTNWVNAGGTLIALRPSKLLASLLGLTDAGGTLSNTYLKVNNASGAGVGITGETIQFHGTADRYTLNGATAVATLYSNANSATSNPAVTTRTVGGNGGRRHRLHVRPRALGRLHAPGQSGMVGPGARRHPRRSARTTCSSEPRRATCSPTGWT